jgi:quercetin dioxygenase-like cupin family protein
VSRSSKVTRDVAGQSRQELEERRMLAGRLHMLRVRRQLTLGMVALGTGLSRSFLALLEAGQSDVSVSRLLRIAEFYGVWLSDLVGTAGPAVEIVRADKARRLPTSDAGHVLLLSLQPVRAVMPFRVELPPGSVVEGGLSHSGEEFVHCVAGAVELEVLEAVHAMAEGDTASFPGRLPHSYRNAGDEAAILVGATARYG